MKNKSMLILLLSAVFIAIIVYYYNEQLESSSDKLGVSGIYVLSTPRTVHFLSSNYDFLSEIELLGGSDLAAGESGKVYVAIAGNSRKRGSEIDVLQNGKLQKKIKLSYSLPWIVKYNPYNKKLYVGHTTKITYHNENCITVIDTMKDEEESNIMHDYGVHDMVFSPDNKMIVSASGIKGKDRRLNVFDLNNNSLINTIPMDEIRLDSMVLANNGLIYGSTELSDDPNLYAIDWQKCSVSIIDLEYECPYRVYLTCQNGKEYVYVSHLKNDDRSGKTISVIDPNQNKVVRKITDVNCPLAVGFNDNQLLVGDWNNSKLYILEDDVLKKAMEIERPMDIVVVK